MWYTIGVILALLKEETKMKYNNHLPIKILIIVSALLLAAGISFGYWVAQYDDLVTAPTPAEQYNVDPPAPQSKESYVVPKGASCTKDRVLFQNPQTKDVGYYSSTCHPLGWIKIAPATK